MPTAAHPAPPGCTQGGSAWLGDVLPPDADPDSAVQYICKYVTKPLALVAAGGPDDIDAKLAQVALAIRGRRLGQGYGVFFGVAKDEEPAPACCRRCEQHNEGVRAAFSAGTDPGPSPAMPDPNVGYVDPSLRFEGRPRQVWRRAVDGDQRARRIVTRLRIEHPQLWGSMRPPSTLEVNHDRLDE